MVIITWQNGSRREGMEIKIKLKSINQFGYGRCNQTSTTSRNKNKRRVGKDPNAKRVYFNA